MCRFCHLKTNKTERSIHVLSRPTLIFSKILLFVWLLLFHLSDKKNVFFEHVEKKKTKNNQDKNCFKNVKKKTVNNSALIDGETTMAILRETFWNKKVF